jgi:hypothetical protein
VELWWRTSSLHPVEMKWSLTFLPQWLCAFLLPRKGQLESSLPFPLQCIIKTERTESKTTLMHNYSVFCS